MKKWSKNWLLQNSLNDNKRYFRNINKNVSSDTVNLKTNLEFRSRENTINDEEIEKMVVEILTSETFVSDDIEGKAIDDQVNKSPQSRTSSIDSNKINLYEENDVHLLQKEEEEVKNGKLSYTTIDNVEREVISLTDDSQADDCEITSGDEHSKVGQMDMNYFEEQGDVLERTKYIKIQKRKSEKCKQKDLENILKVYESLDETKVIANKFQINMTKAKITSLNKCTWLNDEVINYYLGILQERDNFLYTKCSYRKKSYYFNSFFWTKLSENNKFNFDHVKRWTKSFCIFDYDKVFIPINVVNAHWALIVIYINKKKICYYDSLIGTESSKKQKVKLIIILNYLEMEAAAKEKRFSTNEWELIETDVKRVPQQTNSYDCGMFMIYCADYISDDLPLLYNQSEMTDNRQKVFAAILRGYLNY